MDKYKTLLAQIASNAFTNMDIALMAITYWLIESIGMTNENLADILQRVGYTFNTSTYIFSDGTNELTIYQLLDGAIDNIYTTSVLSSDALEMVIDECLSKSLITSEQSQTLISKLATAEA